VKRQKTKENKSKGQVKNTENSWKTKATKRSKIIRQQKRRILELEQSRDLWKNKHKNKPIESQSVCFDSRKAKHHQYSLLVILWVIQMQNYGLMSLRSCRHCVSSLYLVLNLSGRVPSHGSIRNWLCKHGIHRLKESSNSGKKKALYVDESIILGGEKILLILGISSDKIPLEGSVSHQDVEVLHVSSEKEWKAESIADILTKIDKNGGISYIVSDQGCNLTKAYKLCQYTHIEDCTHILANFLKKIYQQDTRFEAFRKLIGELRKKWFLSKENSKYMPPSMRGKLRFANIFTCVDWAKKQLDNWINLEESIRSCLAFLKEHQGFIEELIQQSKIFKMVCSILKNKGFSQEQKTAIMKELSLETNPKNVTIFTENIIEYLENLLQKSLDLGEKSILCSSDIIESFFGKFKQKINPNCPHKLTEFMFTIANFSGNFSEGELQKALENIKIKDLKKYKMT
jgi:hypothetical protein